MKISESIKKLHEQMTASGQVGSNHQTIKAANSENCKTMATTWQSRLDDVRSMPARKVI